MTQKSYYFIKTFEVIWSMDQPNTEHWTLYKPVAYI